MKFVTAVKEKYEYAEWKLNNFPQIHGKLNIKLIPVKKHILVKFIFKINSFTAVKGIWKRRVQNTDHFVSSSKC